MSFLSISWALSNDVNDLLMETIVKLRNFNMIDVCRFSRDHFLECSERTILSLTSLFMLAKFYLK